MTSPLNQPKIIIAGGGPAGLATALHIAQRSPALASDLLLLEAAEYPRAKLCGGAVTFHGEEQLDKLGLTINEPAFMVHKLEFRLNGQSFSLKYPNAMRIFQRIEFDNALADAVKAAGLRVHTCEKLEDIRRVDDGFEVITNRNRYRARVVIGADGAKSMVRRKLKMFNTVGVSRLLRILTPIDPAQSQIWQDSTAIFDFSCIGDDIQGYMWDFPCYVDGVPHMNRGIFDSRIIPQPSSQPPKGDLKGRFAAYLNDRDINIDDVKLRGHPVRWFDRSASFSQPHILVTGDAAGVDPLFGEGISFAMEYGDVAADAVIDAFARNDFGFKDYRQRLLDHRLGKLLMRRVLISKYLYQRRYGTLASLLWALAGVSPRVVRHGVGASLALLPKLNGKSAQHGG